MTSVWPALCPPWKRTTMSACSDNQSTILPLPSSPHWEPTTTTFAMRKCPQQPALYAYESDTGSRGLPGYWMISPVARRRAPSSGAHQGLVSRQICALQGLRFNPEPGSVCRYWRRLSQARVGPEQTCGCGTGRSAPSALARAGENRSGNPSMTSVGEAGTRRVGGWLFDQPYLLLALTSLFWAGNTILGRFID